MKTFTFASYKGGVGKSSLSLLTTIYLASAGKRVLHIDADPQNSSTFCFYPCDFESNASLANVLIGKSIGDNIVQARENIDLIPSSVDIIALTSGNINTDMLENQLNTVKQNYDYCIIDTGSATINNVIANCIFASDLVITPVVMGGFDFNAAIGYYNTFHEFGVLDKWRVVYNKSKKLDRLTAQFKGYYDNMFKNSIIKAKIPESSLIKQYFEVDMKITQAKSKVHILEAVQMFVSEITGENLSVEEF